MKKNKRENNKKKNILNIIFIWYNNLGDSFGKSN